MSLPRVGAAYLAPLCGFMSENVFAVRVQWIMKRQVSHCTLLAAIATPFLALLLLPAVPCPAPRRATRSLPRYLLRPDRILQEPRSSI